MGTLGDVPSTGLQVRLPLSPHAAQLLHKDAGSSGGHLFRKEPSRTGLSCSWISLLTNCVNDIPAVSVSCGCHNKDPGAWWLQTTEPDHLPVLEARNPKARCQQGPLRAPEEDPSSPLPNSGDCSNPWGSLACGNLTPISASTVTWPPPLCVSVSRFPSYQDTSHWIWGSL